jgi:hypothetical protein
MEELNVKIEEMITKIEGIMIEKRVGINFVAKELKISSESPKEDREAFEKAYNIVAEKF